MEPFTFEEDTDIGATWRELHSDVRRRVGDHSTADDIVQETWLRALRRRPSGVVRLRAWLHVVSKRLIFESAREARRRRAREREAARPERVTALDSCGAEHSRWIRWACELEEPYRSVVRMRYLEDREIDEICQRTGRAPATVRSQLKRGLDRLRARANGRDRAHSFGLTALFARMLETVAGPARSRDVLSSRTAHLAAACVLAVVAVTGAWWWRAEAATRANAPGSEHAGIADAAEVDAREFDAKRVAVAAERPTEPRAEQPAGLTATGRVLSATGELLAGATVFAGAVDGAGTRVVAVSDAQGCYEATGIGAEELLWAESAGACASQRRFLLASSRADRLDLVLARAIGTLTVRVRAADGRAVAGALVETRNANTLARTPRIVEHGELEFAYGESRATTDAGGAATLPVADFAGAAVRVTADGHAPTLEVAQLDGAGPWELDVELPEFAALEGRVLDARGRAATGALVEAFFPETNRLASTRSDDRGRFVLEALPPGEFRVSAFEAPERGTTSSRIPGSLAAGERRNLEIELHESTTLRGRVTGADGELAGCVVHLVASRGPERMLRIEAPRIAPVSADGHFVFGACAPGVPVDLTLHDGASVMPLAARTTVEPGGAEIELECSDAFEPTATLSLTIDAPSSEHAPRLVELRRIAPDISVLLTACAGDAQFESPRLPAGSYRVIAWAPASGPHTVGHVTLARGERAVRRFELPALGHVAIEIPYDVAASGGARIELLGPGFNSHGFGGSGSLRALRELSGVNGRYCAELPPGTYDYILSIDRRLQASGSLSVAAGEATFALLDSDSFGDDASARVVVRRSETPRPQERTQLACVTPSREWAHLLIGRQADSALTRSVYDVRVPRGTTRFEVETTTGWRGECDVPPGALSSGAVAEFEIVLAKP